MLTPEKLIEHFGLTRLDVEGGHFRQTYLSAESIPAQSLPDRYGQDKPFSSSILYLLTPDPDSFSAMHRLPTDETFHFYLGDPVEMLQLYPDGTTRRVILGHDVLAGHQLQHVAPRDVWQGSHLLPGGTFALMGTTMAPAFTGSDYLGGDRETLMSQYPDEADLIKRLTRPGEARRMPG